MDNGYQAVSDDGCVDPDMDRVFGVFQNYLIFRCCFTHLKTLCIASHYFFKWIKKHLHIKSFYGTTLNAVYTQICRTVCDYLLPIIAKKRYGLVPSLHSISNSSSSAEPISVNSIISRHPLFLFQKRGLPGNLHYGNISPDSSAFLYLITK